MIRAATMISQWLIFHRPQLLHAARMTAAGVIALMLFRALGLPDSLWAVVTAIVVTQSNVGGSLRTALERFAGSMFGAFYAAAVALALAPDDPLSTVVALAAALVVPSIMAAFSPGFLIAPITAAIMVLGSAALQVGPIGMAAGRIIEVGLGCGVGLFVSILVVPTSASRSITEISAQLADLLAGQLEALVPGFGSGQEQLGALAIRTRESLILLEKLVNESARERRVWLSGAPDGAPLLRTFKRLRHDVDMLRRATREAGRHSLPQGTADAWIRAVETGVASLRRAKRALSGLQAPEDNASVTEAVRAYRVTLEEMRRAGVMRSLPTPVLGRLFGIGILIEQFRRDLDDLIERIGDLSVSCRRSA